MAGTSWQVIGRVVQLPLAVYHRLPSEQQQCYHQSGEKLSRAEASWENQEKIDCDW